MLLLNTVFIWAIILESAFLLAIGGAVIGVIHWQNRKKRLPFTQKMLRPPGESLRLRLIDLDEKLNDTFIQLFLAAYSPLLMAGLVALQGVRASLGVWIVLIGIAVVASAFPLTDFGDFSVSDGVFGSASKASATSGKR